MSGDPTTIAQGEPGKTTLFAARLITAAVQAAALYVLSHSAVLPPSWPATDPRWFEPLRLIAIYVPLIVMVGAGQIRPRALAPWAAIAGLVLAGLGYHAATRGQVALPAYAGFLPSLRSWLALSAAVFIAHVLVVDSVIERRLLPAYPRHFDTSWKQGLQVILTVLFVSIFWGLLYLGAGLFRLVAIGFFTTLIHKGWFAWPATTLAVAVSLHVTDVQPALIRGVRSVALTLFSWLLPVLAVILLGFLCSLPFVSLAPLWRTHFAGALLLLAAAWIVFLINSAYQDGAAEQTTSRIKRIAGALGAVELLPLVGLAAWALHLRVAQYGWTVARILGASVLLLAGSYALAYASAVPGRAWLKRDWLKRDRLKRAWLKRIEIGNVAEAYVFVALVLALFSPVADPARLMVADQMARLRSGAVAADKFDYLALKFDGARWGAAALAALVQTKDGPDAATIRSRAVAAIAARTRYLPVPAKPVTAVDAASRILVYPAGRRLPETFTSMIINPPVPGTRPYCLNSSSSAKCIALLTTFGAGATEAILFIDSFGGRVFEQDAAGAWQQTGILSGNLRCGPVLQSLESGTATQVAHGWPDLMADGTRIVVTPMFQPCPPTQSSPHPAPPSR